MTIDVRASGNDFELFQVQVPGGGVRTLSLDELDAAFQAGSISEQTMVLRSGSVRWMTLAEVAGIEEEQAPNSLAPFATDVAYSNVSIPPLAPIGEVTLATSEIAAFRPKRPVGPVLAVVAMLALIGGVSFGATRYGVSGLKAQLASVMQGKGKSLESARSVAIATPAETPKAAPPPAAVESLPAAAPATPAATPAWAAALGTSTPAKADTKGKKGAPAAAPAARKRGGKAKASNDPTTKGSGQFDPLNGNL